jgi:hypothetical protein
MTQAISADQPARGPDGQLLDASKIEWYNDPDDPHPIQATTSRVQEGEGRKALNRYLNMLIAHFLLRSRPSTRSTLTPDPFHRWHKTCRSYRR